MKEKNITEWLISLTPVERDELPEDKRLRVLELQRRMQKTLHLFLVTQIVTMAVLGFLLNFALKNYPHVIEYLSQYLSQHRLSQLGAVIILVVGCLLYLVRQKWRLTYGLLEVAFATVYGFFSLQKVGGQKGYIETVSIMAAVYLVVRGVDNIAIGWKTQKERIAQRRLILQEFIDLGKSEQAQNTRS